MKFLRKSILVAIILQSCACNAMDEGQENQKNITFLWEIEDEFKNCFPQQKLQFPTEAFNAIQRDSSDRLSIIKAQSSAAKIATLVDSKPTMTSEIVEKIVSKKKKRPKKKKQQELDIVLNAPQQPILQQVAQPIVDQPILTQQHKTEVAVIQPRIIYPKDSEEMFVNIGTCEVDFDCDQLIEKGKSLIAQFKQGTLKNKSNGPFWCSNEQVLFFRIDSKRTCALRAHFVDNDVIIEDNDIIILDKPFSIYTMKEDIKRVRELFASDHNQ